ncbi:alpha/beta hydrolase family protein [Leptolyngbya ohadii]|uniref:alpha/beta hydrolase family protein n=1 Tax=Leptolyngbya ohadii TaxID=1962290 RepID=UPI000B59C340|nr:dienelactone hydrolase family protein [Leptolyngbya ohadii]
MKTFHDLMDLMPQNAEVGEKQSDGYRPVKLTFNETVIHCRYYEGKTEGQNDEAKVTQGVIWVGGVGGDWDSPAQQLYPRLAQVLAKSGVSSLRVRYRQPTQLGQSVMDVLVGIRFLQDQGIETIALVGHSFGGAVVIQVAAETLAVRTVVALASQSYGTDSVPELATRCSLLLLHGTEDRVLPFACSEQIYARALEPKQLILYPDAGHNLDEAADEIESTVQKWLVEQLNREEDSF